MTDEQIYLYYTLIPRLIAEGWIEPGEKVDFYGDPGPEIGQAILDMALEDDVHIDAGDFHDKHHVGCMSTSELYGKPTILDATSPAPVSDRTFTVTRLTEEDWQAMHMPGSGYMPPSIHLRPNVTGKVNISI